MIQMVCQYLIFSLHISYRLLSLPSYCKDVGHVLYSHPDLTIMLSELMYLKLQARTLY